MNVELLKENEDGSASYTFDMTREETEALIRFGILEALKAAIREGDKLKVEGNELPVEGEDVSGQSGRTKTTTAL